jgi:hypothetical protein
MRPIPPKLREEMAEDQWYKSCCLSYLGGCEGKIDWHHHLIYAGRQVNEKFAILPLCQVHHKQANNQEVRERLDLIMIARGKDKLNLYSKAIDWGQRFEYLSKKFSTTN